MRAEPRPGPVGRGQGDGGFVGGVEALPFGFLVLIVGVLLMANAWGVVDARMAVSAAAREGARAYVEADAGQASTVARQRATETLRAIGRGDARATVHGPIVAGGFRRCGRVEITVDYRVPVLTIPYIGGFGALRPVSATHSEVIDPFRDGLEGEARC